MARTLLSIDQKDLPYIEINYSVNELQLKVKLISTSQEMAELMIPNRK